MIKKNDIVKNDGKLYVVQKIIKNAARCVLLDEDGNKAKEYTKWSGSERLSERTAKSVLFRLSKLERVEK